MKLLFQDSTWSVTQSSWLGTLSIVWELDLIGWSCRSPLLSLVFVVTTSRDHSNTNHPIHIETNDPGLPHPHLGPQNIDPVSKLYQMPEHLTEHVTFSLFLTVLCGIWREHWLKDHATARWIALADDSSFSGNTKCQAVPTISSFFWWLESSDISGKYRTHISSWRFLWLKILKDRRAIFREYIPEFGFDP